MPTTSLSEALMPVAKRMQNTVREIEILRVAATVLGKDAFKSAENIRREVLFWVQKRCGGQLPQEAWEYDNFEYLAGGRNSTGIRFTTGSTDLWAIRAEDPDKKVPGRIWTTEVVVGLRGRHMPRFSTRLIVNTTEPELQIVPHAPGFMMQISDKCSLTRGAHEITPAPRIIETAEDANALVNMLLDTERELPVFVLSVPEGAAGEFVPIIDADSLTSATLGLAHVAVLPPKHTWALTEHLGKLRSTFGGAARCYMPGFTEDANPYSHRLFLAEQLSSSIKIDDVAAWMRGIAAQESLKRARIGTDVLSFAAIRDASLKHRLEQLEQNGADSNELLKAANARIRALEGQSQEDRATLNYFSHEHQLAEERARVAEEQLKNASFRIQQLLGQIISSGASPDANIKLPTSWDEFVDWCDLNLAGRVSLSPRARRSINKADFEDVAQTARCLLWLANECRDKRLGDTQGSVSEEVIEEGVRNSHCGGDEFEFEWQGRKHRVDWHIKRGGNTRDPRRCLRIYYFWEPSTQQIVIAEMPSHRRTDAS